MSKFKYNVNCIYNDLIQTEGSDAIKVFGYLDTQFLSSYDENKCTIASVRCFCEDVFVFDRQNLF